MRAMEVDAMDVVVAGVVVAVAADVLAVAAAAVVVAGWRQLQQPSPPMDERQAWPLDARAPALRRQLLLQPQDAAVREAVA